MSKINGIDILNALYKRLIESDDFKVNNSNLEFHKAVSMISKYIEKSLNRHGFINKEHIILIMDYQLNHFRRSNTGGYTFYEHILEDTFNSLQSETLNKCYLSIGGSAKDIAKIVLLFAKKQNILLNNVQLNTILYYIQGYTLAKHNSLLFDSYIKRWELSGPIIEEVYHEYNIFGLSPITRIEYDKSELYDEDLNSYCDKENKKLNKITNNLPNDIIVTLYLLIDNISSLEFNTLRDITRNELSIYGTEINKNINYDIMKKYFKSVEF